MTSQSSAVDLLPIIFHSGLHRSFRGWAVECSYEPWELRRISKHAIRTRHQLAALLHRAHGRQPDVFSLDLGNARVIYTIEDRAVVIRGYTWDLDREPLDDFDGGGHFTEFAWD